METPQQFEAMVKRIHSLTIAVWCLAAVSLALVGLVLRGYAFPNPPQSTATASIGVPPSSIESWEGLPFEAMVKRSTVILITENRLERGVMRAYVREELKRNPGTVFKYGVGAEYPALSVVPKENTSYGDGSLVLLSGSPATAHSSMSIFGGYIPSLENMSLEKVRQAVAASK